MPKKKVVRSKRQPNLPTLSRLKEVITRTMRKKPMSKKLMSTMGRKLVMKTMKKKSKKSKKSKKKSKKSSPRVKNPKKHQSKSSKKRLSSSGQGLQLARSQIRAAVKLAR
jgi:hypothetical protein